MNKVVTGILGFILGAASGAGVTYILVSKRLKKQFNDQLDKEVEAIRRTTEKLSEMDEETNESKKDDTGKGSIPRDDSEVVEDEDYSDIEYWKEDELGGATETREERTRRVIDEYAADYERMRIEEPDLLNYLEIIQQYDGAEDVRLITNELYDQNPKGYEKVHYMYYDDDGVQHIADDNGEEIYGWKQELGFYDGNFDENLFKAYDDTIFIESDRDQAIYEITKSMNTWYDVQTGEADC